tara:strand:- start:16 stop:732 length:717 start_codon:yes stop_codon:yes gene_type:complete
MALPKLKNDRPIYEMVIPSTKETVKYRPFLVKEQKSMLVAFESQDMKQILNAMLVSIESCIPGINVNKLATFDVDYMFTQIRSKSVGETSTVLYACTECNEQNEVKIDLRKVNIEDKKITKSLIEINDDISVQMKYPTYDDMMAANIFSEENKSATGMLMESVKTCMYSVQTKDENIILAHEPKDEVENFINSLTNQQLEKITDFVESLPTLAHNIDFECIKCKHVNKVELKGLQDFF